MHRLVRDVRFSINPFLSCQGPGHNSFTSEPCGEGLALFFELSVGLVGESTEATGFVINVVEIDKVVREHVVPIFVEYRSWLRPLAVVLLVGMPTLIALLRRRSRRPDT